MGDIKETEKVEMEYEVRKYEIIARIASIGLTPTWQFIHFSSVYISFLHSTIVFAIKYSTEFDIYFLGFCSVSLVDFFLQLALKIDKNSINLYHYQTVGTLHLVEDILFSLPFFLLYSLHDKYSFVIEFCGYVLVVIDLLKLHMLYYHYYSRFSQTLGQLTTKLVVIKLTAMFMLICHIFSVAWYMFAMNQWNLDSTKGWVAVFRKYNPTFFNKYLTSSKSLSWYVMAFYYVSNMAITCGFGDFANTLESERLFADVVLIVGYLILTGMYVAYFNECLKLSTQTKALHYAKTILIHNALKGSMYQHSIQKYYREVWNERKSIDRLPIMEDIPVVFKDQMNQDIFLKAIRNCYILKDVPEGINKEIASLMQIKFYVGGDIIVRKGVVPSSMIYIVQGSVDLLSDEDDSSSLMILSEGSSLCISHLLLIRPARVTFRAAGFTVTHELSVSNFLTFLSKYRHFYPRIMSTIEGPLNESYGKYVHHFVSEVESDAMSTDFKRDEVLAIKNMLLDLQANKVTDRRKRWFVQDSPMYNLYVIREWKRKALELELLKTIPSITVYIPIKEKEELLYDDACLMTSFPWIINPSSTFLTIWNAIVFGVVTWSLIMIPLVTAFYTTVTSSVQISCVIIQTVIIFDFFISCLTPECVISSKDKPSSIIIEKLSHLQLYIDFLAVFPFYLIFVNSYKASLMILNFNTMLYGRKVIVYFKRIEEKHSIGLTIVGIMKYLYFFIIGSLIVGCFFFMVACFPIDQCDPDEWWVNLVKTNKLYKYTQYRYPVSVTLYFSGMMLSQMGTGFITPRSYIGYVIVIIFMFVTVTVNRYLMANYTVSLSLNDNQRSLMEDYSSTVESFLKNIDAPKSITERVVEYLHVQWQRNDNAYNLLQSEDLMWDLPSRYKNKLNLEKHSDKLMKNSFFNILAEATNNQFIEDLCNNVEYVILASNDIVSYSGEKYDGFYLIIKGYCKLIDRRNKLIKVLGNSQLINFLESLCGLPNLYNAVTYTRCHLVRIRWKFLYSLLSYHMRADVIKLLEDMSKESLNSSVGHTLPTSLQEQTRILSQVDKIQNVIYAIGYRLEDKIDYLEPFSKLGQLSVIRHLLLQVTFTPYGKFVFYWEIGRITCAFLSAIYIPLIPFFSPYYNAFYIPAALLDLMALIDLYVQMHVCYYNKENILITNPLCTAINYFQNSFITDFLAFLPINYVYPPEVRVGNGRNVEVTIQFSCSDVSAFNRVLQMWRYDAFFKELAKSPVQQHKFLRYIHYLGLTVVFLSTVNLLFILVTLRFYYDRNDPEGTMYLEGDSDSPNLFTFYDHNPHIGRNEMSNIFIFSLLYTSGLSYSVSGWNIFPQDIVAFAACFIVIMLGFIFNNWIIVKLISTRKKLDANMSSFHTNLVKFRRFIKKTEINEELKIACNDYYQYLWYETEGVVQNEVLTSAHETLRADCVVVAHAPSLLKVPIFKKLPPHCIRDIAGIVRLEYICKNVNVLTHNIIYNDIYIVKTGLVHYYSADGKFEKALFPGSIFGNLDSFDYVKSNSIFKTAENTTFIMLKPQELNNLAHKYDELRTLLQSLSLRKLCYVPGKAVVESSEKDEVPTWILRLIDYYKYKSAELNIYLTLIIYLIGAIISISNLFFGVPNMLYWFIFFDLFQITQIFLLCNKPYYDYNVRKMITNRSLIRKKYLRTADFYLRIVSMIPFFVILYFVPVTYEPFAMRYSMINLVLYVHFTSSYIKSFTKRVDINMLFYVAIDSLFYLVMGTHIFTGLWKEFRCPFYSDKCLISLNDVSQTPCTDDSTYACCIYIVLQALTTAGIGDILPVTPAQIFIIIVISIGGVFIMAVFIGNFADIVDLMRTNFSNYSLQVSLLTDYMKINHIPEWHIKEQTEYCKRIWFLGEGKQLPIFMQMLPTYLKREVHSQLYGRAFTNNFIFSGVAIEFLKQMLLYAQVNVYMTDNAILHEGQASEALYLVLQGEVQATKDNAPIAKLTSGAFFGLRSGLFVNVRSTFTYKSLRTSYIIKLNLSDWNYLLDFFPSARSEIYYRAMAANITPYPNLTDFFQNDRLFNQKRDTDE